MALLKVYSAVETSKGEGSNIRNWDPQQAELPVKGKKRRKRTSGQQVNYFTSQAKTTVSW